MRISICWDNREYMLRQTESSRIKDINQKAAINTFEFAKAKGN